MNVSRCDLSESLLAIRNHPQVKFREGDCYRNAFTLLALYLGEKPVSGVIGYVLSTDGKRKVAVRHSWVRDDETGQAIDVTAFVEGYSPVSVLNFDYAEVMVMSPEKWLRETENNGGRPCLDETPEELAYIRELKKQGYEILDEE